MDMNEDLVFSIEANDDDTEISLVLISLSGRKITQAEFIVQLEGYLHEVSSAEALRIRTGAQNH